MSIRRFAPYKTQRNIQIERLSSSVDTFEILFSVQFSRKRIKNETVFACVSRRRWCLIYFGLRGSRFRRFFWWSSPQPINSGSCYCRWSTNASGSIYPGDLKNKNMFIGNSISFPSIFKYFISSELQIVPIRGIRHVNVPPAASIASITAGGIGQREINVTIASDRGQAIDSLISFYG